MRRSLLAPCISNSRAELLELLEPSLEKSRFSTIALLLSDRQRELDMNE
ncbi:MAG: hypothetical protein J7647_15230 [Cyanobacteria bacterium SBLK]|nr:hypothetical protein [Cyanobacteria bacterium SBLK]